MSRTPRSQPPASGPTPTAGAARLWCFTLLVVAAAFAVTACGGRGTQSGVAVGPRLAAARLGSVRSALTYDGDWMGGLPSTDSLAQDLELAARRGVEVVVDLRSEPNKRAQSLIDPVIEAGMDLVEIDPAGSARPTSAEDGSGESGSAAEGLAEETTRPTISDAAVDQVRTILQMRGRQRALLLDETGEGASLIYAIHLTVDKGVEEVEALRAARAIGLDDSSAEFVHQQVERIRTERGR